MSVKPRTSLSRVMDDLGDTFLELIAGRISSVNDLGGVVIYDRADDLTLSAQAIVLGVGVHDADEINSLIYDLGRSGAAVLVVRAPVETTPEVLRAVRKSGVVLLGLTKGASWSQLAAMLRTLLAESDVGDEASSTIGGLPSGDLFALSNAIASLLDAPITIEDRSFNVLAFSGRQDEADASRVETILGRQVPQRLAAALEESGILLDLYRSTREVYLQPERMEADEVAMLRVAVAIRAGDEVLGSIWAAVPEPLSKERTRAFIEAAKLVSLHMLRIRAGADVERRLRADLIATALEGGAGSPEALARLGLLGRRVVVLAIGIIPTDGAAGDMLSQSRDVAERQRFADALSMHLSAVAPRSAVALLGDVTYGLLPITGKPDEVDQRVTRIVTAFLSRTGSKVPAVVGIGADAKEANDLVRSRTGADRALRVLLNRGEGGAVATTSEVQIDALLLEMSDAVAARGDRLSGPIAKLESYDAQHNGRLMETLECWLNAFGDVAEAAGKAFVHTNTFRYRLKRVSEVSGLDLTDPDARFNAMLQLRLIPRRIKDG